MSILRNANLADPHKAEPLRKQQKSRQRCNIIRIHISALSGVA